LHFYLPSLVKLDKAFFNRLVRFDRCFWDAERLPNLAEAQLGVTTEQHDRAVARGQCLNCIKEQLA
jgi:hypothetical protein